MPPLNPKLICLNPKKLAICARDARNRRKTNKIIKNRHATIQTSPVSFLDTNALP